MTDQQQPEPVQAGDDRRLDPGARLLARLVTRVDDWDVKSDAKRRQYREQVAGLFAACGATLPDHTTPPTPVVDAAAVRDQLADINDRLAKLQRSTVGIAEHLAKARPARAPRGAGNGRGQGGEKSG